MKKIQDFYLFSYRLVGFIFLTGLIASIIWYGFSMIFFIGNTSWSVPMILSPNQEKVMAHLEHVLSFEHEIAKGKSEIMAAEQVLHHKKVLLANNKKLWERVNESMNYQSHQYSKASKVLQRLSNERITNVAALVELAAKIKNEEDMIDQELNLRLITKQEAMLAHLNWNKLHASLVDSKTSMYDLKTRAKEYEDAANTLNGSGNNLKSMNKVIQKVELESQIAQLESDIFSLDITIKHLQKNIAKQISVLHSIKNSPYILATKKSTTVAFVPYTHLKKVKIGAPVYSCYVDMILCYKSGKILTIYNAEEYNKHPIFRSDIKGQLIGIAFEDQMDAQKKLLFINSKPLLL